MHTRMIFLIKLTLENGLNRTSTLTARHCRRRRTSHVANFSSKRSQMAKVVPMVICQIYSRGRVCETRSKKDNENIGRFI